MPNDLGGVPFDVLHHVASFLSPDSLRNLSFTNRSIHDALRGVYRCRLIGKGQEITSITSLLRDRAEHDTLSLERVQLAPGSTQQSDVSGQVTPVPLTAAALSTLAQLQAHHDPGLTNKGNSNPSTSIRARSTRSRLASFDAFEAEEEHTTDEVAPIREWLLALLAAWTDDPIPPRVEDKLDLPVPVGTPQHAAHKIQSHKDAPSSLESRWLAASPSQAKLQGSGDTNERGLYSSAPILPKKSLNMSKVRKGLPLCFTTTAGTQEILTKYDTGTMANHMSLDLAKELDYNIDYSPHSQGQFTMANGKIVTAVGRITTDVTFLGDGKGEKMTCYFNVFKSLAFPALIGMAFLHATETLSKYTSRLVDLPMDYRRSLRLCAVGEATNQVLCVVNGNLIVAHADTGAEIALISAEYAAIKRLRVKENCEELMLADGSIDYTTGFTDVIFRPERDWQPKIVRLHVLTGLQFDILLDEGLVNDFDLFRNKACSLVNGVREMIPSIAPVIHLGSKLERGVANAGDKMKGWTKGLFTPNTQNISNPSGSNQGTTEAIEAKTREKKRVELRQRINDLVQEHNRHQLWASRQSYSEAEARKEMDRLAAYQRERISLDDKLRDLG